MGLTADKTFYPTAKMAMEAPKEELAYIATLNVHGKPDSLATVDVNPESDAYLSKVGELTLPNIGDEFNQDDNSSMGMNDSQDAGGLTDDDIPF